MLYQYWFGPGSLNYKNSSLCSVTTIQKTKTKYWVKNLLRVVSGGKILKITSRVPRPLTCNTFKLSCNFQGEGNDFFFPAGAANKNINISRSSRLSGVNCLRLLELACHWSIIPLRVCWLGSLICINDRVIHLACFEAFFPLFLSVIRVSFS